MNYKNQGVGHATGKIILIGEHAVVYGKPAIAVPFGATHVTTVAVPSKKMMIDCNYFSGELAMAPENLKNITQAITKTLELLKKTMSFSFTITSTIPPERGMGSSAAVAVSVIRSLFDYYDYNYSVEELKELTNAAEKIAHGNPSGIDCAATSGSQPLFFVKGQPIQSFLMNLTDTYLVVADTGIKGQTRAAVQDVAHLFDTDKKNISLKIEQLGQLTLESKQAILTNEKVQLGKAMKLAQQLLSELTVSHPAIDQLVEAANANGALGAKLTGGGRGGCVIALADSFSTAETIAAGFWHAGAVNTWIQSLEETEK